MKKSNKNPDDYNLVFHESKFPTIELLEIKEHKDGSAIYVFKHDNNLVELVKKSLKLIKKPTKKQISKFLLEALENTLKDDKYGRKKRN